MNNEQREREKERGKEKELKNVAKPKKTPDELSRSDSKKSPSDEIFVRKLRILPVFSIIYMIRIRFFGPRELIQN